MTNPLRTIEDYELFLYTLQDHFPSISRSNLILTRRGVSLARVSGDLEFAHGIRLVLRERIVYHRLPAVIDEYGYEVWHGKEKLYWYDSQPHPDDPTLQDTYPHHKHVQPGMKRNRIPAPQCSFQTPNLPALILEVEGLVEKMGKGIQPKQQSSRDES
jgi:hypothetical protein